MTNKTYEQIELPRDPTAVLEAATKQYVDNTTADAGHGHAEDASLVASLRAHANLSGGGNISLTSAYELSWSQRFIIIANGNGSHFSTAGHFSLNMPASGAVISGVGATADVTVTAGGIPLGGWQALYAVLTIGGGSASYQYAITNYNVAHSLPSNYVLLAVRNGDNGRVHLSTGMELAPGETRNEADTTWTSRNFDPASKSDTTHLHDTDYVHKVTAQTTEPKAFIYPLVWGQSGNSVADSTLVIETPITFGNYMVRIKIRGYNYHSVEGANIDVDVGFYAYSTSTFFQPFQRSLGTLPITVRLAEAGGKVVLLLDHPHTYWRYPKIIVEHALVGHSAPPDSFHSGWAASITTDLTPYTVKSTPPREAWENKVETSRVSQSNVASRIVERDGAGDIRIRLLRSEFTTLTTTPNYLLAQHAVGTGDNYARPASLAQVKAAMGAVGKYTTSFGSMTASGTPITSQVVKHNLGTQDVHVTIYDSVAPHAEIECDVEHTDANTVTLRFDPRQSSDINVVVTG